MDLKIKHSDALGKKIDDWLTSYGKIIKIIIAYKNYEKNQRTFLRLGNERGIPDSSPKKKKKKQEMHTKDGAVVNVHMRYSISNQATFLSTY